MGGLVMSSRSRSRSAARVRGPVPLYPQDRPRVDREGAIHRLPSWVRIHTVLPLRVTSASGARVLMRWGTQAYMVTVPRWSVRRRAGQPDTSSWRS
jgi:hypothetical protein